MIRHIVFLTTGPLVCVLLAFILTEISSADGLWMTKGSVVLHASRTLLIYPCPPGDRSVSGSCPTKLEFDVTLTSEAKDFHKQATYVYTVTAGRVVGEGSEVTWDLGRAGPGIYTAAVEVRDSHKKPARSSVTVKVSPCSDCLILDFPWPTIVVTCNDTVKAGTPITCKVGVGPSTGPSVSAYKWSARSSKGEDLSDRLNSNGRYVSIPTNGLAGQTVYTRVDLEGLDRSCSTAASGSTRVEP